MFFKKKDNPPELEGYFFRMTMVQLMGHAFTVGDITYVPIEFIEFADRYEITLNRFLDNHNFEEIKLEAEKTVDLLVPIRDGDITFYWDVLNKTFRTLPDGEGELMVEYNPYVKAFDNGELRIEKEYAEHNLSRKARGYAYRVTDEFYSWNYKDNSELPVLFEMPSVFEQIREQATYSSLNPDAYNLYGKLSVFCYIYYVYADVDDENFNEKYSENMSRTLWQPEN